MERDKSVMDGDGYERGSFSSSIHSDSIFRNININSVGSSRSRYALPFFNHQNPLWGWGWGAPDITTEMFTWKGLGTLLGHMLLNYPIRVGLRYYAGMMVGIGAAMPVINLEDTDPQNPSFAAHAAREFNTAAFALAPLMEAIQRANAEDLPWEEAAKNALSAMATDPRGITLFVGMGAGLFLVVLDKTVGAVKREVGRYNQDAPHRLLKFFISVLIYAGVQIAMSSLIAKGIISTSTVNDMGPLTLALLTAMLIAPLVTALGAATVDVALALNKGQWLPTRIGVDIEIGENQPLIVENTSSNKPSCGLVERPEYRDGVSIS